MTWLARALAGPMLWGALFSAVYALHGAGCNLGWTQVSLGPVDLHRGAMWAVWAAGLAVHVLLVVTMPAGQGRARRIIVAGSLIGLVASAFTLFPVIATSTCF
ncbi:hypothetical protein [Paracoccus rhizosphaerae]|uniref:Uncharacterized protein n=1 Tax=Paracoccus rhizosphaerae TaxID=1133347 RepID=A0ABV6CLV3_9RHOB|nr:hypothetical protein [Paracoccus rhizosphaerae]